MEVDRAGELSFIENVVAEYGAFVEALDLQIGEFWHLFEFCV